MAKPRSGLARQVVDYKEKKKWKFMQKYWHKGAYYQTGADDQFQEKNTDDIFGRDFSAPTGEDKFDKTILPKVMQVRFRTHYAGTQQFKDLKTLTRTL